MMCAHDRTLFPVNSSHIQISIECFFLLPTSSILVCFNVFRRQLKSYVLTYRADYTFIITQMDLTIVCCNILRSVSGLTRLFRAFNIENVDY